MHAYFTVSIGYNGPTSERMYVGVRCGCFQWRTRTTPIIAQTLIADNNAQQRINNPAIHGLYVMGIS